MLEGYDFKQSINQRVAAYLEISNDECKGNKEFNLERNLIGTFKLQEEDRWMMIRL